MKKFIQSRWFPILVAIAILGIASVILIFLGFKITYAPEMENNWDAVSAVAAWAGAIGTVAAVFSAIWVANRQNKIAMLEKRLDVFKRIEEYIEKIDFWEYNYDWFLKLKLSESEIRLLFNQEFADFYVELEKESKNINILWGDYEYAKKHDECHKRSEEEIEIEIQDKVKNIRKDFKDIKEKMYSKYLCI